jgi:hypothetical protein
LVSPENKCGQHDFCWEFVILSLICGVRLAFLAVLVEGEMDTAGRVLWGLVGLMLVL